MEITKKTISQMMEEVTLKYPNQEALVHTEIGTRYNYSLLSWEVSRVARGLLRLGVTRGDKVALWAWNIPEWIISQLALAKIGALMVPVDPGADKDDFRFILEQSETKALIMAKGSEEEESVELALSVKTVLPSLELVIVIADKSYPELIPWGELAGMGDEIEEAELAKIEGSIHPQDPVAIMYTSGTTGRPKGVVLDHKGLINKSIFSTKRQGITHQDRLTLFFPLFHMFGNTCIALAGLLRGATIVIPCKDFHPSRILQAIFKEKCTAIYGSPSMIIGLLDHPEFQKKKWKSVTKGTIGGAPCPMELMRRLVEEVGVSHITVAYGITEASSWITMTRPDDPIELRTSTIGMPLDPIEVKIVDPVTGEELSPGNQGELCTRGFLMKEYFRMPVATKAAIDQAGWFHSGDLGELDEKQYVKITGRLKDVIIRDGIEVYPVEVEEVLYGLPEISEVQVFGFNHPKRGQEIAAWVKLKEGTSLEMDSLANYARKQLGVQRTPNHFKVVDEFPMTRSGKVQKFKLAEFAEKEYS